MDLVYRMPRSAAFPTPPRYVTTAGDRTQAKRDSTIYRALAQAAAYTGNASVAPLKSPHTGQATTIYQKNYFTTSCQGKAPQLAAAHSYDLLRSAVKGKFLSNPMLHGAAVRSVPTAYSGNYITVGYGDRTVVQALKFSSGVKQPELDASVKNTIGAPGPDPDDSGTGTCWPREGCNGMPAPSYVIDPSATIFRGPVDCDALRGPWKTARTASVDTSFQTLPGYWRQANGQPLTGISNGSNISFSQQEPLKYNESSNPYPPNPTPETKLDVAWCNNSALV